MKRNLSNLNSQHTENLRRDTEKRPFKRTHTMERLPMTPLEKLGEALETCIVACQGRRNSERAQAVLDVIKEHGFDRDSALEDAATMADDHTPAKHDGTLAAHVTGRTIAEAIRGLKLVPPEEGK